MSDKIIKLSKVPYFLRRHVRLKYRWYNLLKRFLCMQIVCDIQFIWPFSNSKFNLKSDRVNLVASASPIECLLYLHNVRAIQYKLGPERLTRLGNSNILRLPVIWFCDEQFLKMSTYTIQKVDYQNVTLWFMLG